MSFKDLACQDVLEKTAEVRIGEETFTVRAITDPTRILEIQQEAQARTKMPVTIEDQVIKLNPVEAGYYMWLAHGIVSDDEITYVDVVAVSRKTGLDCITAGLKVMELSGIVPDNMEDLEGGIAVEAKND